MAEESSPGSAFQDFMALAAESWPEAAAPVQQSAPETEAYELTGPDRYANSPWRLAQRRSQADHDGLTQASTADVG